MSPRVELATTLRLLDRDQLGLLTVLFTAHFEALPEHAQAMALESVRRWRDSR